MLLVIFVLLYVTYHDLADTLLVLLLAVPGAVAGGMLFQYLFGFPFTVAVWVGYIACFGLATQSGVVMLVYLREAIDRRGGLENIASLAEVRAAIMDGAVHRTRPKLLTETTTIVGLAPMLWATASARKSCNRWPPRCSAACWCRTKSSTCCSRCSSTTSAAGGGKRFRGERRFLNI